MTARSVGKSVKRVDADKLITGNGQFLSDIKIPGLLDVCLARATEAHALITSVNYESAREMEGVREVFVLDTLGPIAQKRMTQAYPNNAIDQEITQYPLANNEICYVGEGIAAVVADNRYIAEDAARMIEIQYETLPAVIDAREALKLNSPLVNRDLVNNVAADISIQTGNIESAFANSAHIFTDRYYTHRGGSHSIEGRGVIAKYDEALKILTIWTSSQAPFQIRRNLSDYLNMDETEIRVIAPDVGGGFGPKAAHYPEELLLALIAMKTGWPVRWVEDRYEHFVSTFQLRDAWWDVSVGCTNDGQILGIKANCIYDNGAYLPYGLNVPFNLINPFPGPYNIKAMDLSLKCVYTNAVPCAAIRGAGRPIAAFVLERILDRIAKEVNISRPEVRRRNFIRAEQMPYDTGVITERDVSIQYDSGDYSKALELVLSEAKYDSFAIKQKNAREVGRAIGFGLASYVEDTGHPPYEGATVSILPSGRIRVELGSSTQGQGLETVISQVVADKFGVSPSEIIIKLGDTNTQALGISAVGSRVTATAGPSAHLAAEEVRKKVLKVAAGKFEVAEEDLELADGIVSVKGIPEFRISLADISRDLISGLAKPVPLGISPGLSSTVLFSTQRPVYTNGVVAAEVEVDVDTGFVKILNYWVVHDCGVVLNPDLVNGQILGGTAHGIGNSLYEKMIYDYDSGQPLTTNFSDYLLPLSTEIPRINIQHMETPSPVNPLGVKGAGEGGTIPAMACLIGAIENALEPYNVEIKQFPITPPDILNMINNNNTKEDVQSTHAHTWS